MMEISGYDFEHMEMAVLVGGLLKIKQWNRHFERLESEGNKNFLDDFRVKGLKVIHEYRAVMALDSTQLDASAILKIC